MRMKERERERGGGGGIYPLIKGVEVDDLPPHSTDYNYAYKQENQQTNSNVLGGGGGVNNFI